MKTFYIPFNIIERFTQKDGKSNGEYRHYLAQRIYLALIHVCSGRIQEKEKVQLIKYLNTSHTAFNKALSHLIENNLIIVKSGYISAKGSKRIGKSKYNVKFQFNELELIDPIKYKNKIFQCLCQMSAIRYGKKKKVSCLFPQRKNDFNNYSNHEFIQQQSSSYLVKLLKRHKQTIYRNQAISRKTSNPLKEDCQLDWGYVVRHYPGFGMQFSKDITLKNYHEVTEMGFRPKEKSTLVYSDSIQEASLKMAEMQKSGIIKPNESCYIAEGSCKTKKKYAIVNPMPISYKFSIPCKKIRSGLDLFFQ